MRVFFTILSLFLTYSAIGQSGAFKKAQQDYYNFQYVSAIEGFEPLVNDAPKIAIKARHYLAMSYFEHGYINEAINHVIDGSNLAIETFGEESAEAAYGYLGYGKFYHERQSYDTAKMFYQTALALIDKRDRMVLAEIYANMGYAMDFNEEFDSALLYYQKAAEIMEGELGLYHTYVDWLYGSMPFVAENAGLYEQGVEVSLKSLDIKTNLWGENSEEHAVALRSVAVAYEHLEDYQSMQPYVLQLLEVGQSVYGVTSAQYADYLRIYGSMKQGLLQHDVAIANYKRAYEISKKVAGAKDPKTLNYLHSIADGLFGKGDFQEALKIYQQYFGDIDKSGDQLVLIEINEDVASCFEELSDYQQAERFYQKALALKESEYQNLLPSSYISLARIAEFEQNFQKAQGLLDKAAEANRLYNDNDQETLAFVLNNRGVLLQNTYQFDEALEVLQQSLTIRKELFGENSRQYAQTSNSIGNVYNYLGQDEKALTYFSKSLDIELAEYGETHPNVASTLVNMSNCYSDLDQYQNSLQSLEQAENILNRSPQSPVLVSVYYNTAVNYTELVQYDKAKIYAIKHKELVEKLHGKASEDMANNWNLMGMIFHNEGLTSNALDAYEQAISIYKELGLSKSLAYAGVLNNIGLTTLDYEAYSLADDYFHESLRIYEAVLPSGHRDIITTKINLGLIEDGKGNYEKAMKYYEDVLGGFGNNMIDTLSAATTYQNLAIAQNMLGRYDQAIASAKSALQLFQSKLGSHNTVVAGIYNNLAIYYQKVGLRNEAIESYNLALSYFESDNAYNGMLRVYLGLSDLAVEAGDYQQAIDYADLALTSADQKFGSEILRFCAIVAKVDGYYLLYQREKGLSYLEQSLDLVKTGDSYLRQAEQFIVNEEDKVQFATWKSLLTIIGVKASYAMYQESMDKTYLEEALFYAEKSKSNVLLQSIKQSNVRSYAGVDQQLVEREREIRTNIEGLEQQVFKLTGKADQQERRNALSSRLFSQKQAYQLVLEELLVNPKYRRLNNTLEITTLAQIQNRLQDHEAVIEYAPGDSTLYTFVITKSDIEVFANDYGDKFDGLVTALRNAIVFKSDGAFEFVSRQLYELSLRDVENYFKEQSLQISKLTIVPEGPFNYFPFESLKRGGRYLIEDYDINYSYSMTLSGVLEDRVKQDNGHLLSFAPVFDDKEISRLTPGALDVFEASRTISTEEVRGFSVNGEYITPLPGTKEEVEALSLMANRNGKQVETYVFEQAKEEVIKSGVLKDYQYIHFATHGFVNEANPAFSGVFMSQKYDSDEDCVLFASEIYNLTINADLVTLSACETGLGRFAHGEGIVGLSRAFMYAGAKSLVVSQWQVNDASTAKLMVDFYEAVLSGKDKSSALRQAKLNLISTEEFKQPYYWAPFVLIGQ